MSYLLGIIIDGQKIQDVIAKEISLCRTGFNYNLISGILIRRVSTIRNDISATYNLLDVPSNINALIRKAKENGVEPDGFVNGKDILEAQERVRFNQYLPRLSRK